MKKFLLLMLGLLLTLPAMARDFTYQGLTYTVISEEDKTCQTAEGYYDDTNGINVSGNTATGDLVIPSEVTDGKTTYTVVAIGNRGFYGCDGLTSVTIPEGVTSIGHLAFFFCSSLTSITIPEGVKSIYHGAFVGCTSLTSVSIPGSVTLIDTGAFVDCSSLTSVTIPGSVTSIGASAFCNCSSLTSVTILEGVTSIGGWAFDICSSLTSISIPESVTSIGREAFRDCSSLTSITIPEGVTSIGSGAFEGCSSLTSLTIPKGVTSISYAAFEGCSSLTSISIPKGVTEIKWRAFEGCGSLTSVYYAADKPISGEVYMFSTVVYENATLYMTEAGAALAREIDPWKNFKNIVAYDFSGIEDITADFKADEPYEVYKLNGVKVGDGLEGLTPGLYLLRQGHTTSKILVK